MIRVPKVRVIGADGSQIGIMLTSEALKKAQEQNYDLVEVAPTANPPVCKIMDYGKYKYQQSKRAKDAKKKQHIVHLKEIKLKLKISDNDLLTKIHYAEKFIKHKDKVKFTLILRGRETTHSEMAYELMKQIEEAMKEVAQPEHKYRLEGRVMTMVMIPLKGVKIKKDDSDEKEST